MMYLESLEADDGDEYRKEDDHDQPKQEGKNRQTQVMVRCVKTMDGAIVVVYLHNSKSLTVQAFVNFSQLTK